MKTTIELPDELLVRAKVAAARERSTVKQLIIEGLEYVLGRDQEAICAEEALERLNKGYPLGGKSVDRNSLHER